METPDKAYRKVAFDVTWLQMMWALWGIAIALAVYAVIRVSGGEVDGNGGVGGLILRWMGEEGAIRHGFDTFAIHPSKIFMLVIGITSVSSFMTFFVKQGVTRTAYFFGTALSTVVVALGIALIVGSVGLIERSLWPSIRMDETWMYSVGVHALHMVAYYVAGWVIGAGFHRFGESGGVFYILLAVASGLAFEAMWLLDLGRLIVVSDAALAAAPFLGSLALIGAMIVVVRASTKRARVLVK